MNQKLKNKKQLIKGVATFFSAATLFTVAAPQNFYAVRPGESNGISAQQQDLNDRLLTCAENGNLEELNSLLDQGADVNARSNDGYTALMFATAKNHKGIVEALLTKKADVDARDNDGYTALMWAATNGHINIVNALLNHGANVDAYTNAIITNGWTALMLAATKGHIDIVNALLNHSANVNILNNQYDTALTFAAKKGYTNIVNALLEHGANVNNKNQYGEIALMFAVQNLHVGTVKALLKRGDTTIENCQNACLYALEPGNNNAAAIHIILNEYIENKKEGIYDYYELFKNNRHVRPKWIEIWHKFKTPYSDNKFLNLIKKVISERDIELFEYLMYVNQTELSNETKQEIINYLYSEIKPETEADRWVEKINLFNSK